MQSVEVFVTCPLSRVSQSSFIQSPQTSKFHVIATSSSGALHEPEVIKCLRNKEKDHRSARLHPKVDQIQYPGSARNIFGREGISPKLEKGKTVVSPFRQPQIPVVDELEVQPRPYPSRASSVT